MVHQPINRLTVGDAVEGIYLLRFARVQHSKNGSEYLLATLSDKSGSISCIVWNYDGSLDGEVGAPILVTGKVAEYQGNAQIVVRSAKPAPENDVILSAILPTSPVSSEILYHRVRTARIWFRVRIIGPRNIKLSTVLCCLQPFCCMTSASCVVMRFRAMAMFLVSPMREASWDIPRSAQRRFLTLP